MTFFNLENTANDKFTFDVVSGNLESIVSEYNNYVSSTSTANEVVSEGINNGESSGINSSVVGRWFSAIWAANTSYAEEFKDKFVEWSQLVTKVMRDTGDMDEEAQGLYKSFDGLAELTYNYYNFNTSSLTGSNAGLLIEAETIYKNFAYNYYMASRGEAEFDPSAIEQFLQSDPSAKTYIADYAFRDVKNLITAKEEELERQAMHGKIIRPDEKITINTAGLSPVAKEIAEYYNTNGVMPSVEDLKIFNKSDWSGLVPTTK